MADTVHYVKLTEREIRTLKHALKASMRDTPQGERPEAKRELWHKLDCAERQLQLAPL